MTFCRESGILPAMPAPSRRKPAPDPHRTLRAVTVANPYYSPAYDGDATNPKEINAVVNIKESAAVVFYTRGGLDNGLPKCRRSSAPARYRLINVSVGRASPDMKSRARKSGQGWWRPTC
ncbi:hypothetical protein [Sinorhizobium alkalisoli]|uniref:hypothetical protein n=1 Tax=Sinorhizobium alkalisoli TaxID=1752398 RepID=UPI001FEAB4A9|nr:hypothetical protein [Sinorhizobium alkalisoli]